MPDAQVFCDNLVKIYRVADLEVVALQGLDLRVVAGEMLALVGASGSGKSTLMNILGGLDTPTAGTCRVAGADLARLGETRRLAYRRQVIGHVWQQSGRNLVGEYTLARNVDLPQVAAGVPAYERAARTRDLLKRVGLEGFAERYPRRLSGGEQQRASIAVALANRPRLLLADEPTGELDSVTAAQIVSVLRDLNQEQGLTVIVVTHDPAVAAQMDRVIAIRDGRTSAESVRRRTPEHSAAGMAAANALIGLSSQTHREAIIVDKVGRLQLPREMFERMRFGGRVEARDGGDHLELWPLAGERVEGERVEGERVEGERVERESVEGESVEGESVEGESGR
jgi:ABC-type lipoprotein export system ATPase subunit